MVYSGAWGKLIHEKYLKSKISWHCPFKGKDRFLKFELDGSALHTVTYVRPYLGKHCANVRSVIRRTYNMRSC
jgi:hypothetical protein